MTEKRARSTHLYPIDHFLHANEARLTGGLSPSSAMAAYMDWAAHLANSPGKQDELVEKALRKRVEFWGHVERVLSGKAEGTCIEPLAQDRR